MSTVVLTREKVANSPKPESHRAKILSLPTESSNPSIIPQMCGRYKLTREDIAQLSGYSLRSIYQWAAGKEPTAPAKKQFVELSRLLENLAELMESSNIGPWLRTPNEAFANSSPMHVIERGEQDQIWHMIYQLETGEPE